MARGVREPDDAPGSRSSSPVATALPEGERSRCGSIPSSGCFSSSAGDGKPRAISMLSLKPITAIRSPAKINVRNWSHVTSGMPASEPGRHRTDDGDTVILQVEEHADDGRRGDGDQRRRPSWRTKWIVQQQPQRAHADGERRQAGVVDDLEGVSEPPQRRRCRQSTLVPVIRPSCPTIINTAAPAR